MEEAQLLLPAALCPGPDVEQLENVAVRLAGDGANLQQLGQQQLCKPRHILWQHTGKKVTRLLSQH